MNTAGVDGCRGGWICTGTRSGQIAETGIYSVFADRIRAWPSAIVAVDIPIGLPSLGSRDCDRLARRLLGPRRASVFPAPLISLLGSASQREASERRRRIDGVGISIESFNILAKV
ncbi:MAG: DUF429 domain-containing protein, partial [Dehalococcoidia bacterium]